MVSAVAALVAVLAGVLLVGSPESVAMTVMLYTPAAEGVPVIAQFGLAAEIVSPGGRPAAVQFAIGKIPPVVGIVAM